MAFTSKAKSLGFRTMLVAVEWGVVQRASETWMSRPKRTGMYLQRPLYYPPLDGDGSRPQTQDSQTNEKVLSP